MAHISIKNLTVDFRVYGSNSRSLKNQLISQATGGRIAGGRDDSVTVRALDDISLEIFDGDRIGLVGHNGAGKTTLLRTIAGIYKPTAGSIVIDGAIGALIDPIAGMDMDATGFENIYLRAYVLGMSKRQIDLRIEEIAEFTELGDFLNLPIKTYSNGMYSRLGFAISTSIDSDILLVDEYIWAGDASFLIKVEKRVHEFVNKSRIFLFATHDENLMNRLCNKKLEFSGGRIAG